MNTTKSNITLIILFASLEIALFSTFLYKGAMSLSFLEWIELSFAGSFLGAVGTYLYVGNWLRFPFTRVTPHPSGFGEYVEPKHTGWLEPLGVLFSCPICFGVWSVSGLLILSAFLPGFGRELIAIFGAGGALRVIVRLSEMVEQYRAYQWELTGKLVREREINDFETPELAARLNFGADDDLQH